VTAPQWEKTPSWKTPAGSDDDDAVVAVIDNDVAVLIVVVVVVEYVVVEYVVACVSSRPRVLPRLRTCPPIWRTADPSCTNS